MSPTARRRRSTPAPDPFPERGLAELGIGPGDQVRFRRTDSERWKPATVARRERDGSVGLHDSKGASRSIPLACIEVRGTGPRGGTVWEPLAERAARTEQMALVSTRPAGTGATRGRTATDPEAARRDAGLRRGGPTDETDETDPAAATGDPVVAAVDVPPPASDEPGGDAQLRLL